MKFSAILAVAAAAAVQAKVFFTNVEYVVTPGTPFTLGWANNTGPVTITLKNGPALALKDYLVIDSDDSGKSYTWTPPSTLPSDTYAFEITDSSDPSNPNYSPQWQYFATDSSSSASGTPSASGTATPTPSASGTASTEDSTSTTGSPSSTGTAATTGSSSTTLHSSTSSRTSTSATTSATSTSSPQNTNNGQKFQSPLALVLVTVAALLYFN